MGKAQDLGAKRVIGVDIDDTLVSAAWKHRRSVWSQQGPVDRIHSGVSTTESSTSDSRKRWRSDRSDDEELSAGSGHGPANYFPASFEHMFGPLPIPSSRACKDATDTFPHNVAFRSADWVNEEIPEDAEGYNVVVAYVWTVNVAIACAHRMPLFRFSISKWIHLNGGDEGLKVFFRRVHNVLRPGGTFVLEPQEWDTYGKAKRMDLVHRSFPVDGQIAHLVCRG